jgi:hypothetical protein
VGLKTEIVHSGNRGDVRAASVTDRRIGRI